MQKLKALNLLEAAIVQGQNAELVCYAERKILNRLLQLARFKKESSDPGRGALLFGKNCKQNHSALFLKYLLDYIKGWAEMFPTYQQINALNSMRLDSEPVQVSTDSETEFLHVYNTLLKEHVAFPSKELFPVKCSSNQQQQHRLHTSVSASRSTLINPGGLLQTTNNSRNMTENDSKYQITSELPFSLIEEHKNDLSATKSHARSLIHDYHILRKQMSDID